MNTPQQPDDQKRPTHTDDLPDPFAGQLHETDTDPKWADFNRRMEELRKRHGRQRRRRW